MSISNFDFILNGKILIPLMQGGMGVNISTAELALSVASNNGVGHISDAMILSVSDDVFKTSYTKKKYFAFRRHHESIIKSDISFDLNHIYSATRSYVENTINQKKDGLIFVNCMEKLTMGAPKETLKSRLNAALDGGIDGISLSAGLHLNSLFLIKDNPRFNDVSIGIIVSSKRALEVFIKKNLVINRLPDFVVVEGPMAGGHLGFGQDWMKYDLRTIFFEIKAWLDEMKIKIPLIPAGGIFTNQDAKLFMDNGAAAIQVATRFTVAKECGLPEKAKIAYLESEPEDIVVNTISPTGYPMRMLKQSPGIGKAIKPNCEAYGYLLDSKKKCSYIDSYRHVMENSVGLTKVEDKTCLCTHMRNYSIWTCGSNVWRLKSVVKKLPSGKYELPTAQSIIADYLK